MCVYIYDIALRNRFVGKDPINHWGKSDILQGFT